MSIIYKPNYRAPSQLPTAVLLRCSDEVPWRIKDNRKRVFYHSTALEERIAQQWGTRRYSDPVAFLNEQAYVGIMKGRGTDVQEVTEGIIDALISTRGGIDELSVTANEAGYRATVRTGRTVIQIRYDSDAESMVAYCYQRKSYNHGIARSRVQQLQVEEPRPDKEGWRDGSTTTDLGVLAYGSNPVVVNVRSQRKKPLTFTEPERRTTVDEAVIFIREAFAHGFAESFPNEEERAEIKRGAEVQFTLLFRGYKSVGDRDAMRDQRLEQVYLSGVRGGIQGVFRNLHQMYTREPHERKEEVALTEDEWFTEVYLKAEGNEERRYRVVNKDDPFYRWACREARKKPDEKPVSLPRTTIFPTAEGVQEAYERALAEKRKQYRTTSRQELEGNVAK